MNDDSYIKFCKEVGKKPLSINTYDSEFFVYYIKSTHGGKEDCEEYIKSLKRKYKIERITISL